MLEVYSKKEEQSTVVNMELARMPRDFYKIYERITRKMMRPEPSLAKDGVRDAKVEVVDGFEDVLGEPLGAGFFYNYPTSVHELAFVLSVAPNFTHEDLSQVEKLQPREIIKKLRRDQVLVGLKILDLGCGVLPGFALAAKALGAEVYTADTQDISKTEKANLDGHILLDLKDESATSVLLEKTGGNFDIVTENIIGKTPFVEVEPPEPSSVMLVGNSLLKVGGYLLADTKVFRKI